MRFWTTCPSFSTIYFLFVLFMASTIFHCHQRLALVPTPWASSGRVVLGPRDLPQGGMFTINSKGRLGNQMGEYATLYALAKVNGRPAFIPAQMHSMLAPIFRITLPAKWAWQATFVGVHVRRGDYVHVMPRVWKGVLADRGYLRQALDWFRARYRSPVFVVTSDDMAWCRQNINSSLRDVVFAGSGRQGSPAKDFALLTQCNHTIITVGTFGIWAAYLAGGDTVYLANFTLPDSPFHMIFKPQAAFLPEWVGIAANLGQARENSP
ncbi:hypothetical protein HPG69_000394 [Diceros bicornis minor]|uniref:L-Fucosyltransferase n=1 Tax=Diceros bicornis minor TaxID=77932 RepID=A0A7J7FCW2_DICBM|nr:hypothetical protein HPG69_000394 [Diceros bicornis minor]